MIIQNDDFWFGLNIDKGKLLIYFHISLSISLDDNDRYENYFHFFFAFPIKDTCFYHEEKNN